MSRALHPPHQPSPQRPRDGTPRALIAWGLVLAVAMLSFFVHLVSDHVARAHALQRGYGAAATAAHVRTARTTLATPPMPEARAVPVLAAAR